MPDSLSYLEATARKIDRWLPLPTQTMPPPARPERAAEVSPRFKFRGNNARLQEWIENEQRPSEIVIEGAAQTGKTYACLQFIDAIARKYRNARGAIIRQVHADLASTVIDIYLREFVKPAGDITIYGGESPIFFQYERSGTRIWCAGMDRPGKVLSGGLDFVYFNQCEESKLDGWQTLSTRTTGRAGAIVPGILLGDMNPAPPAHWMYSRESAGSVMILPTTHKDNPALYTDVGELTSEGQHTLGRLSKLTGVLRARLFEGKRTSAAGLVFDEVWNEAEGSVTEAAEYVPDGGSIFWAADDGYSAGSAHDTRGLDPQTGFFVADAHPRVFLLCQQRSDGSLNVFYESSKCLTLTDDHIKEVQALGYPAPAFCAHGPGAAEFRGRLQAAGIAPNQRTAKVSETIAELRSWLAADDNGFRKLRVHPRCRHTRMEFVSYAYAPGSEEPIAQYDHHIEALRNLTWILRRGR